jgi:hypothetical protein
MTQRTRALLALLAVTASLAGSASAAAPQAAPRSVREVITVERTSQHGLAAVALIGKVKADKVPGFFAVVDRSKHGAGLDTIVDFNGTSGLTRYGHGSESPLCSEPVVCSLDLQTNTLTFTLTATDDADAGSDWLGYTRYFAVEGSSIDVTWAAVGFTVKRHVAASFARVSRDQADSDGVSSFGTGAEVFRSAQLTGGKKGSFAVVQLPCDTAGAGAATFSATGDVVPSVVNCAPEPAPSVQVGGVGGAGTTVVGGRPAGIYFREAAKATQWQVSGAVSGLSSTTTRLFVLSY